MDEQAESQDPQQVYRNHGYRNRAQYLKSLADDYCVPLWMVQTLANMLGPNEDFDGLIRAMEDGI